MADLLNGTVKWFNEQRGFGFITPADGGKDVFAHISGVVDKQPLKEGQKVEFEITQGKKGPQASRIQPL